MVIWNIARDNAKRGNIMFNIMSVADDWADKVGVLVGKILGPILIIGCSVGMIYAIVVGIQMMKADSKDKREENKARLINIAISIVAIAVLIGLFYALKSYLTGRKNSLDGELGGLWGSTVGNPFLNTINLVKQCASMIIFKC